MARKDEEKVKLLLSNWVGGNVLWEKKNTYGMPVFKCDHAERPDLLILHDNVNIAVEVKYANTMSNVLDGITQVLRYACSDMRFYVNNTTIRPDYYVLATQFSIKGHLFDFEQKKIPQSDGRLAAAGRGEIPFSEYRYTFLALRSLWRFAEYERDVHGWNWNVGVGFLLSNVLNTKNDIAPLVQAKTDKKQHCRTI